MAPLPGRPGLEAAANGRYEVQMVSCRSRTVSGRKPRMKCVHDHKNISEGATLVKSVQPALQPSEPAEDLPIRSERSAIQGELGQTSYRPASLGRRETCFRCLAKPSLMLQCTSRPDKWRCPWDHVDGRPFETRCSRARFRAKKGDYLCVTCCLAHFSHKVALCNTWFIYIFRQRGY